MRKTTRKWRIWLFIVVLSVSCKKPYNPQVISSPNSYLVVEGVINTNDVTNIRLSKTVNISTAVTSNPVEGAQLSVESDNGSIYDLSSIGNGVYQLTGATLDNTLKFRLNITTDGKKYQSDFEQAKVTPPIDSVGFIAEGNELRLYANTHDPNNNTHYYRFDYTETWKFHAKFNSSYVSNGQDIVPRSADQYIYYCFANSQSSNIILGSTAKLKQDVIYQSPITAIASTSEKIETKYSILVHQYALTEQGYKFWESLRKNTEQLGSIFDAEPSQLSGNIHNLADPAEPVIGYISAGTVSSKRIFITSEELPQTWSTNYPYECVTDSLLYMDKNGFNQVRQVLVPGAEIPVSAIYNKSSRLPVGYVGAEPYCVDCTLRGTKQQPDFWK
jgi:hypothetical protein